jgi:hypothetical protein
MMHGGRKCFPGYDPSSVAPAFHAALKKPERSKLTVHVSPTRESALPSRRRGGEPSGRGSTAAVSFERSLTRTSRQEAERKSHCYHRRLLRVRLIGPKGTPAVGVRAVLYWWRRAE